MNPMKTLTWAAAAVGIVGLAAGWAIAAHPGCTPPGYRLVWADEFDGAALDLSQWRHRTGAKLFSRQLPENVSLENGLLRIDLKKEATEGYAFTGGGVITRKPHEFGYFETRAKLPVRRGWHAAFWSDLSEFPDAKLPIDPSRNRLEFDCFEHRFNEDMFHFSYGIHHWSPELLGSEISRDTAEVAVDLGADFHVYGYEVAEDYAQFYFDGQLLRTVDLRELRPWHPVYLWRTCIATTSEVEADDVCWFDYLRVYAIDPEQHHHRKKPILAQIDASYGPTRSAGTDLWIDAKNFTRKGGWKVARNGGLYLLGHTSKASSESDRLATTRIDVPESGNYVLWVRSGNFTSDPKARRSFRVAVGQERPQTEFGNHGQYGWAWEKAGEFRLEKGPLELGLIDVCSYYARCQRLLLTTDPSFVPQGRGGPDNVQHR